MGGLIYTFVAYEKVVLAEYSASKGNFRKIGEQCLAKLPPGNSKLTFPHGKYTLNFLADGPTAYLVLADQDVPETEVYGYLGKVKDDFKKKFGTKCAGLPVDSLNRTYSPKLKEFMAAVEVTPKEADKTAKIKGQVAEVKKVMQSNVQKALSRGEKLEVLKDKASDLENQASTFKKKSVEIKEKEWWKNMWTKIAIGGGILLIIVAILAPILAPLLKTVS